jgi:hypothetical protein
VVNTHTSYSGFQSCYISRNQIIRNCSWSSKSASCCVSVCFLCRPSKHNNFQATRLHYLQTSCLKIVVLTDGRENMNSSWFSSVPLDKCWVVASKMVRHFLDAKEGKFILFYIHHNFQCCLYRFWGKLKLSSLVCMLHTHCRKYEAEDTVQTLNTRISQELSAGIH